MAKPKILIFAPREEPPETVTALWAGRRAVAQQ